MLLQLFLQHTELPTQRAGSISLLVGCYLARGLNPQAKSFVTLGFSTAMSWESAAAPADWDATGTESFLQLMHGEKVQLEGPGLRIRRVREDMTVLRETVKSCICRCLEREHTVVDLCVGKETSHCELTNGYIMRHRESEGAMWCFPLGLSA